MRSMKILDKTAQTSLEQQKHYDALGDTCIVVYYWLVNTQTCENEPFLKQYFL